MTRTLAKTLAAIGFAAMGAVAFADTPPPIGWSACIDPQNNQPYSPDFGTITRNNDLMRCTIGGSGTVTYGGQNGPCFAPSALTVNVAGRVGFGSGPTGSVQSNFDDDLMYTFGMPTEPGGSWSYATIMTQTTGNSATSTLYNAPNLFFSGLSHRYIKAQGAVNNVLVTLQADILGDASRLTWDLTNLSATPTSLGMWYGAFVAMITTDFQSTAFGGPGDYIVLPGRKPVLTDRRILRNSDPSNFPPYVQFCFDQTNAYGMQVDLGPTPSTSDNNGLNSDATFVDELVLGSAFFLLNAPPGNDVQTMPDFVFGDAGFNDTGFIVKYQPTVSVPTNGTRRIIQYVRDTWGNSRYAIVPGQGQASNRPFSTVVDAPHLLANDDNNTGSGTNNLLNNPFTVRVWIDNVGGFSGNETEISLSDVHVRINLPAGMALAPGETQQKILSNVGARQMAFVDWQVEADGVEVGDLPYSVTVSSTPGPTQNQPMIINGIIRVAATPLIRLQPAANLISSPWVFNDTSWESVLGLDQPTDFTAYDWDPQQNSYIPSTAATRGKGTWIILNPNTHPTTEIVNYNNPTAPPDTTTGAPNIQLKAGWNLIGNPYQYAFPIGQLVGVSAANSSQSFRWSELVAQGIVSPFLAYWDAVAGNYRFVQGTDAMIQPNRGYWVKVLTSQDLTLNFPAIYDTFVPNPANGPNSVEDAWAQSTNHWRLNLQARSREGSDVENYVGAVNNANEARLLKIYEPPTGPVQNVTLSIVESANAPKLAQSISGANRTQDWDFTVTSKTSGPVTLTWPNMISVPRSVNFRLVDTRTNQMLDMRQNSSVTLQMVANSTRTFKVRAAVSTTSQPIIGTVSATAGRLGNGTPATMRFVLNEDATVTLRILNSSNQTVATLRNGEVSNAGENAAAWNLRNMGNGLVQPGTYRAEVRAVVDGRSLTKVVSFTVSR